MKSISIKKTLNIIVLILLFAGIKNSSGQNPNNITLSQPNGIELNQACQYIKLVPGTTGVAGSGYIFSATTGNYMKADIDNTNMCDVSYLSGGAGFSGNNPPPLNTNLPVGTINGTFDVDPNGGADYSIALVIPPGTMGMAPSLSLNYSSEGSNGLLGTGWSLGGLTSITRTTQNVYNDGKDYPVTLTNNDRFLLGGNRLIVVPPGTSSDYGLDGTIYQTENETFQQVISHGQTYGAPAWFEVDTKDGKILQFGNTTDSRILACGSDSVLCWLLNSVTDNKGNYMNITYYQNNTTCQYYPLSIEYTGTADFDPYNKVTFSYALRSDPSTTYVSGFPENQNVLLTGIQMYAQNTLVHHYQLDYSMDALYSHLSEITEYGSDGSSFNSTKINYHTNLSQAQTVTAVDGFANPADWARTTCGTSCYGLAPVATLVGDINGDGRSDIIDEAQSEFVSEDFQNFTGTNWTTYTACDGPFSFCSGSSGTYTNGSTGSISTYYIPGGGGTPAFSNSTAISPIDMNGDGMADMVLFGVALSESTYQDQFQVSISNGSGGFSSSVVFNGNSQSFDGDQETQIFSSVSGNFDGSGYNDLVIFYPGLHTIYKFSMTSDLSPATTTYNLNSILTTADQSAAQLYNSITTIDINGDGRSELLLTAQNNIYIFDLNTDGTISLISTFSNADFGTNPCYASIYPGDFNGDGKTDLLIYNNQGWQTNHGETNNWYIGISNGLNGFTFYSASFMADNGPCSSYQLISNTSTHNYYVADFNGDGIDDIVDQSFVATGDDGYIYGVEYPTYNEMNFAVYYGNGNVGSGVGNAFISKSFSDNIDTYGNAFPTVAGDFDGDGHTDLAYITSDGSSPTTFRFDYNTQPDDGINKAIDISNGLNVTTNITYNSLPYLSQYPVLPYGTSGYAAASGATFPVQDVSFPMYVVSTIQQDNGNGTQNEVDYAYTGALSHAQGKGFLGFTGQTKYSVSEGIGIQNTFDFPNVYFDQLPSSTLTFQYSSGSTSAITTTDTKDYTYTTISDPAGITPPTTNPSSSGYYEDVHYNYLNQVTDDNELYSTSSATTYTVDVNGNMTTQIGANAAVSYTTTTTYTTEANVGWSGQLPVCMATYTTTTVRPSQTPYTRYSSFSSNSYGQLTQSNTDIGVITTYTYDAVGNMTTMSANPSVSGNFPTHTTTYTYEPYKRFPISQNSAPLTANSHATYDNAYGDVLTSTDVNGLVTTNTYDGFGRLTQTTTPTLQKITNTLAWNTSVTNGLYSAQQTQPGAATITTYYSKLGQTLRTQTTAFDGNNLIVNKVYTDLGQVYTTSLPYEAGATPLLSSMSYDEFQRPVTVTAASGAVATYSYVPSSTQVTYSVTAGSVSKTGSVSYDQSGKPTSLTDNAGTVNYSYASCNQLQSYTLPGTSDQVTVSYDAYGRKVSYADPDAGTTTYTYDDIGELITQAGPGSASAYTVTYDALGRMLTVSESISGEEDTYTYDNMPHGIGLLGSVAQSFSGTADVTYNYTFDTYSRLQTEQEIVPTTSTTYNNTTTYAYDALNRITQVTYPDMFAVDNAYNSNGYVSTISTSTSSTPIWTCNAMNAFNQVTNATYGNSSSNGVYGVAKTYDNYGYLTRIKGVEGSTTIMDYLYAFNDGTGDLNSRADSLLQLTESFTNDAADRLINVTPANSNAAPAQTISYDGSGNISEKSDIGDYVYGASVPHAVASIQNLNTATGNIVPLDLQVMAQYTPFNKVSSVTEGSNTVAYTYGPDHQKKTSVFTNGTTTKTVVYDGNYEYIIDNNGSTTNTYGVHYIQSPDGLFAIDVKPNGGSDLLYHVHTDHLGSILGIYTSTGVNAYHQSFDAWGNYRDTLNWTTVASNTVTPPQWLIRGYTGAEHLNAFGLVNMNGRMYDPLVGHMLSPDPNVTFPDQTQNYNRFAYCLNNPLKYTDPTGYSAATTGPAYPPLWGLASGSNGDGNGIGDYYGTFWDLNNQYLASLVGYPVTYLQGGNNNQWTYGATTTVTTPDPGQTGDTPPGNYYYANGWLVNFTPDNGTGQVNIYFLDPSNGNLLESTNISTVNIDANLPTTTTTWGWSTAQNVNNAIGFGGGSTTFGMNVTLKVGLGKTMEEIAALSKVAKAFKYAGITGTVIATTIHGTLYAKTGQWGYIASMGLDITEGSLMASNNFYAMGAGYLLTGLDITGNMDWVPNYFNTLQQNYNATQINGPATYTYNMGW